MRAPRALHPRIVRFATIGCVGAGVAGFAAITTAELSNETMVIALAVLIPAIFGAFFATSIWSQNRLFSRQDALVDRLGLERSGASFEGEVEGAPVRIRLRLETGRSWDDRTRRHRAVTTVEETIVRVGRDREAPPPALSRLGVTLEGGAWTWRGPKNVLDDPAAESFVRRLAVE